jgi:hypothetical protein
MMRRKGRPWRFVIASFSIATFLLAPQVAQAAPVYETVTFMVIPPVGGSGSGLTGTATLNCGWHSSCQSPYDSGTALDWKGNNGSPVHIRGKVTTTFAVDPARVVRAKVFQRSVGSCTEIVAEIWGTGRDPNNAADDLHVANLHWQHTGRIVSGPIRTIYFNGSKSGVTAGTKVGEMVNEVASCPWSGPHTHSYHTSSGTVTRNTSQIPASNASPCPYGDPGGACNYFSNGSPNWSPPASHWERRFSWSYCIFGCIV